MENENCPQDKPTPNLVATKRKRKGRGWRKGKEKNKQFVKVAPNAQAEAKGAVFQTPHESSAGLSELSDDLAPRHAVPATQATANIGGNSNFFPVKLAVTTAATTAAATVSETGPDDTKEKPRVVEVSGLPSEIKIIVQEKLKGLSTVKKPIIMPSTSHELPKPQVKPSSSLNAPIFDLDEVKSQLQGGQKTFQHATQVQARGKGIEVRHTRDNNFVPKKAKMDNVLPNPVDAKEETIQNKTSPETPSALRAPWTWNRYAVPTTPRFPSGIPRSFLAQQPTQTPYQQTSPYNSQNWMEVSNHPPLMGKTSDAWLTDTNPRLADTANPPADPPTQLADNPQYSPTAACEESEAGRVSAFSRLGPANDKPKLTINLNLRSDKEQHIRQVVQYVCPADTPEVMSSLHPVVRHYRALWPWRRPPQATRHATTRQSKSVMMLEQEQMAELYDNDQLFIQVCVRGFPSGWTREMVLDHILEAVGDSHFVPVFIDLSSEQCRWLVLRCKPALIALHRLGCRLPAAGCCLSLTLADTDITLNKLDFVPRLILRKILNHEYDGDSCLNLKEFTRQTDLSNFIYFPLSRLSNQKELVQVTSAVCWENLTDLDLSENKLTSIEGFKLSRTTPRLRRLSLAANCLSSIRTLVPLRQLPLRALCLEHNPLCRDYTEPAEYVALMRRMFSQLRELDGVSLPLPGALPLPVSYGSGAGAALAASWARCVPALLDRPPERALLSRVYRHDATLSITHTFPSAMLSRHRGLRALVRGGGDAARGGGDVARVLLRWPELRHDPNTFTLDVMHHDDNVSIFRVCGMMKVTSESLAEDELLVWFSRSLVLTSEHSREYRVLHELLALTEPTQQAADASFQMVHTRPKTISLVLDTEPDEDLKHNLVYIFMKLTNLDEQLSKNCLEKKSWNLKTALEHFTSLLKLNDLDSLRSV